VRNFRVIDARLQGFGQHFLPDQISQNLRPILPAKNDILTRHPKSLRMKKDIIRNEYALTSAKKDIFILAANPSGRAKS
jgi:hypothetical protein